MYPDLLPKLAQCRREDLLRQREFREQARLARARPPAQHQRPFRPLRQSRIKVGSLLIRAGARLSEPPRAGLDLVHK
jgi:hypothetical protein